MNWLKLTSYVFALVICISEVSEVEANAVYKCVDNAGNVAYQLKPCKSSVNTEIIEIKEFKKPKTVKKKTFENNSSTDGANANSQAERRKERAIADCKHLKKNYHGYMRTAKKMDKSRIESKKSQEEYRSRVSKKALKKMKKGGGSYKKYMKKHKKAFSGNSSRYSKTHEQDRVKENYKRDKKRLGCDKL